MLLCLCTDSPLPVEPLSPVAIPPPREPAQAYKPSCPSTTLPCNCVHWLCSCKASVAATCCRHCACWQLPCTAVYRVALDHLEMISRSCSHRDTLQHQRSVHSLHAHAPSISCSPQSRICTGHPRKLPPNPASAYTGIHLQLALKLHRWQRHFCLLQPEHPCCVNVPSLSHLPITHQATESMNTLQHTMLRRPCIRK